MNKATLTTDEVNLKIIVGDKTFVVAGWWWEGEDFCFVTDQEEKYVLKKAYPVSMSFEGLEYSNDQDVFLGTTVYEPQNQ